MYRVHFVSHAIFTFLAVLVFCQFSQAQSYELGDAHVAGSGCPAGSVAASLSPDGKTISLLFDKLSVETKAGQSGFAVANCVVRIAINNISPGYMIDTTSFDIRGFAALPSGSYGYMETRGGTLGSGHDDIAGQGINDGDFDITRVFNHADSHNCHARAKDFIRLNVMLRLRVDKGLPADSMIVVDSADMGNNGELNVGVVLQKCDDGSANGNGNGNGNGHGNGNGNGHGNGHGHG